MLMQKWFNVCGFLSVTILWACSSDMSPTNINAEQNPPEQENIPVSLNAEVVFSSSSSGSFNQGTPIAASSSAIAENVKKTSFLPVDVQIFSQNTNGEFYLLQLMKYTNYDFLSDSVYSFKLEIINYNEDGRKTLHDTANYYINGNKTTSNGVSHHYKYVDETQINYQNVFSETESINDIEINWVIYYHNKYKTITNESQIESEIIQTTTKELTESSNDGKEYILRSTQNGEKSTSYTKLFLDANDFKTKTITYDSDNSFLSGNIYSRMPNAPENLSKGSLCYQPMIEGNSTYEYYYVSCKDVVSTSETYQLVIEHTSKIKNYDSVTRRKDIYTYNRFDY